MHDLTPRWPRWVLGALVATLLLPLLATFLYSISTRWGATLLPDGFTLDWYLKLWGDPRFLAAFKRGEVKRMVVVPKLNGNRPTLASSGGKSGGKTLLGMFSRDSDS